MSGLIRSGLCKIKPLSKTHFNQVRFGGAGRETWKFGPPKYSYPLWQKGAVFSVMACVMCFPMINILLNVKDYQPEPEE